MIALRVVGGAFGVALLVGAVMRYRKRDISRLNLIITSLLSIGVVVLAILPAVFDPVFELFNFRPGSGRRLTAVLLFADIIIFALLVRNISYTDINTRSIRLLVEALAVQAFDWSQVEHLPPGKRVVVAMPAYNEADNVGPVVHAMPEQVEGYPVVTIVCDDGSEDNTSEVARRGGAVVARLPIRRGQGLALRVGFEIALKLDAVVVVAMDADGQHLPEEMPLVVKPILEDQADMVNGSRMLGEFERESVIRHAGVHFFSRVVTLMTGSRVTDVSSGYRAMRADMLKKLVLEQDQFWTPEILIESLRQRLRITEVPITIRARASGKTKKPKTFKYAWKFSKALVQTWLR